MTHALTDGKATQQQTKAHNDSLVLSTIYEAGEISRAAVARRTALSRTSVGEAVAELLERDLVEEVGRGQPSRGKPPILLRVKSDARHLIGIDLSGEEFRGAVVNLRGEVRHALQLPRDGRSGAAALELANELVDRLMQAATAPVLGVGVGTPGLIDLQRGSQVHWAVNLDWLDLPLRQLLELRYQVPVHVLNDSQAAAMGEYFFGNSHAGANLVVVKCEEGLGAGIVLEGRLVRGEGFGAGEIGHLVFAEAGQLCRCGNTGCLETLASASAIVRATRAAAAADPRSVLHDSATHDLPLDMTAVRQASTRGDVAVQRVIRQAGRALGVAVATFVSALNVQDIVIAGRVTELGDALLHEVRQEMLARCLAALARDTRLEFSAIGEDITALGAAAVLLHQELGIWPMRPPLARQAEDGVHALSRESIASAARQPASR
jgi:predicted NBD/HSP70 family sugar kinase